MAGQDLLMVCERKVWPNGRASETWVQVHVKDIHDATAIIRCAHCHGVVKIHRQRVAHGPGDHVEHQARQDSEWCRGGVYFQMANRQSHEHRMSMRPVR
jgi:hypothetical protein